MALAGARASGSIAIPAGPHSAPLPSPGASFLMTPPPTAYGQRMGQPTPPVGVMTPMPFASEIGTAPTQSVDSLPVAARQVSLHDIKEPLPQKYKVIAAAILLAAVGVAVFMFVSGGGKGGAAQPTKIVPVPVSAPVDRGTVIKAALHDLESGKTCADRKAAIPTLVQYGDGDDQVLAALKHARYRMRGGVLGIGDSNTNQCLKQDAEMAIQQLEND
jgi:hypothetical protein